MGNQDQFLSKVDMRLLFEYARSSMRIYHNLIKGAETATEAAWHQRSLDKLKYTYRLIKAREVFMKALPAERNHRYLQGKKELSADG